MAGTGEKMKHAAERKTVEVIADQLIKTLKNKGDYDERTEVYLKIVDMAKKFYPQAGDRIEKARAYVSDPNHRWMKVMNHILMMQIRIMQR